MHGDGGVIYKELLHNCVSPSLIGKEDTSKKAKQNIILYVFRVNVVS